MAEEATGSTRRPARAAALAWPATIALLAAWGAVLGLRGRGLDFAIYVRAAERFAAGAALSAASDGPWVYKYAPPTALLFAPFALLPLRVATAAWNLLLVAALAAIAPRLRALLAPGAGDRRAPLSGAALAAATLVVGQSTFLELFYGQVDLLMLLLLVASAECAERGRDAAAGAAWALAVAFKPPAILFAVYLLTRRRRAAWAGVAAGLALWLPVLARYGARGTAALAASWSETVARTTAPWILGSNSQGLPTLFLLLGTDGPVSARQLAMAQGVALLVSAAALLLARRSRAHLLAAACFAAGFASALAWRANFVLALPMVALGLCDRSARRGLTFLLVAVCAAVELTVAGGLLRPEQLDSVLLLRPFAIAFGALFAWTVATGWAARSPPEPGDAA